MSASLIGAIRLVIEAIIDQTGTRVRLYTMAILIGIVICAISRQSAEAVNIRIRGYDRSSPVC
jgi:hypothetical protein